MNKQHSTKKQVHCTEMWPVWRLLSLSLLLGSAVKNSKFWMAVDQSLMTAPYANEKERGRESIGMKVCGCVESYLARLEGLTAPATAPSSASRPPRAARKREKKTTVNLNQNMCRHWRKPESSSTLHMMKRTVWSHHCVCVSVKQFNNWLLDLKTTLQNVVNSDWWQTFCAHVTDWLRSLMQCYLQRNFCEG